MRPAAAAYVRGRVAPNPGPMTLEGTNTWIIGAAGSPRVVVDPGPAIPRHLDAVFAACEGRIGVIVLTHRHLDHAEGAAELATRAGCGVQAVDPAWRIGPAGLPDGELIDAAGATLEVVATPGHTGDSCSLLLTGADGRVRLLTGDTVLGRGTSVIAHPDGDLGDYLGSLDRLVELVAARAIEELLPGHGPIVTDPAGWLPHYRRHREERLQEVREALAAGDRTPAEIVARVYAGVDPSVRPAAEQSVRAQLHYLSGGPR